MLLAHVVLAQAYRGIGDPQTQASHAASVADLQQGRAAEWARGKAAALGSPLPTGA